MPKTPVKRTSSATKARKTVVTVPMTPEFRARLLEAVKLPWVADLPKDDLRFPFQEGREWLEPWLARQALRTRVPSTVAAAVDALLAADRMTVFEEFQAVVEALARRSWPSNYLIPKPGTPLFDDWLAMMELRYMSPSGPGRPVPEVASKMGVAEVFVHKSCRGFQRALSAVKVVTPALGRVMTELATMLPVFVDVANERLVSALGDGVGVEAALAWNQLLGRNSPASLQRRRRRGAKPRLVRPEPAAKVSSLQAMVEFDSQVFGCTTVARAASLVGTKNAKERALIKDALEELPGFRWLHQRSGWFALGDGAHCEMATELRKVFSLTVSGPLDTAFIEKVLKEDQGVIRRRREQLGLMVPPAEVLEALLSEWDWLEKEEGGFRPREHLSFEDVLTAEERTVVETIDQHNLVATWAELQAALGRPSSRHMARSRALTSIIVRQVQPGLYALVTLPPLEVAIEDARERLVEQSG